LKLEAEPQDQDIGQFDQQVDRDMRGTEDLRRTKKSYDFNFSVKMARKCMQLSGIEVSQTEDLLTGVHLMSIIEGKVGVLSERVLEDGTPKPKTLPGGKNERSENAVEALTRELREEGVSFKIPMNVEPTFYISYMREGGVLYASFFMTTRTVLPEVEYQAANEKDNAPWVKRVYDDFVQGRAVHAKGKFVSLPKRRARPAKDEDEFRSLLGQRSAPGNKGHEATVRVAISLTGTRKFFDSLPDQEQATFARFEQMADDDFFHRIKFTSVSLPRDMRLRVQQIEGDQQTGRYNRNGTYDRILDELQAGAYAVRGVFNPTALRALSELELIVIVKGRDLTQEELASRVDRPQQIIRIPVLRKLLKSARLRKPKLVEDGFLAGDDNTEYVEDRVVPEGDADVGENAEPNDL
jgi:hypothetical protein